MRITTKAVYDWEGNLLEWEGYEYSGQIAECKHEEAKSAAAAQQARDNKLQQQAFDAQMATLKDLKTNLSQYLTGNVGFDPQQLALLQTQFLSGNAQDFNSARSGVMSSLAARGAGGGQGPLGGDYTRGLSGLYGAEATAKSSGLANIGIQNLQQALTNKFNTANVLSGNAATLSSPISTFGSGASNALNNYTQAALQPGFANSFFSSLAGGLGQGLGAGLTGGLGKAIGCWIAAECFNGWDDVRTIIVRESIDWDGFWGKLYARYGKRVASIIHRFPVLKCVFRPIFNRILERAYGRI